MNRADPVDVLARTVWGEARSDGRAGMEAVASVVLNRARHPRWWGTDVLSVCLDPWQFSCWNQADPNLPKLSAVDDRDAAFQLALLVAHDAVNGVLADPTGGADSYYEIGTRAPSWAVRSKWTRNILGHAFYRVELPAPTGLPEAPCTSADQLNAAQLAAIKGT